MLSSCFLDFSVSVGAFVIVLSQISSFFSIPSFSRKSRLAVQKIFRECEFLSLTPYQFNHSQRTFD